MNDGDLINLNLLNCDFQHIDSYYYDFCECNFYNCTFKNCQLLDCEWNRVDFYSTRFLNCNFQNLNLKQSKLITCELIGFYEMKIKETTFTNFDFSQIYPTSIGKLEESIQVQNSQTFNEAIKKMGWNYGSISF